MGILVSPGLGLSTDLALLFLLMPCLKCSWSSPSENPCPVSLSLLWRLNG